MTHYQPQVSSAHYSGKAYSSLERWDSYYHQLALARSVSPQSVLEVGVGQGVVARELRAQGIEVKTLDIAADLHPDLVGSVTAIPLADKAVDLAIAAEVLEHIEFKDVPQALSELGRVARTHVLVSVPHPGWVFHLKFKFPLVRFDRFFQIPFFWQTHTFNGQHYWEL